MTDTSNFAPEPGNTPDNTSGSVPDEVPGDESENPQSIFLAVVDSLRANAVFGPDSFETPSLDRLASQGLAFEARISRGILTGPSMTAILTGGYSV